MGMVLGDALHGGLKGLPSVIGIRSLGLAGAVELASVAGAPGKRAYDVFMDCFKQGVLVRPAGENIVICPPYIVEKEHIERIVNVVGESIKKNA
jgi:beta-alanine--pyruvate transaminase